MKILHTSDLHIGISLINTPLLHYQQNFCKSFCKAAGNADAVIIAGDVFDNSVASAEAIKCWSDLVSELCLGMKIPVIVCAGNHDGAARLSSCSELLKAANLYISGNFEDAFKPVIIGNAAIYSMPYFNPSYAALILDCKPTAASVMEAAAKKILDEADPDKCNILSAHCFAAGAYPAESDISANASASVGGADRIPLSAFDGFDYVALGHIHKPQTLYSPVTKTIVRYSGTPLPYAFSEGVQQKTFTIFDTDTKTISELPAPEEYRLRVIEDTYENILKNSETDENKSDLIKMIVTDQYNNSGIHMKMKDIYPNLIRFIGKKSSDSVNTAEISEKAAELDIISLAKLYLKEQRDQEADEDELGWLAEAFAAVESDDKEGV